MCVYIEPLTQTHSVRLLFSGTKNETVPTSRTRPDKLLLMVDCVFEIIMKHEDIEYSVCTCYGYLHSEQTTFHFSHAKSYIEVQNHATESKTFQQRHNFGLNIGEWGTEVKTLVMGNS